MIDWVYREEWQADTIERDRLEWLLGWMRHCHDPRRFEIADGLCVALIGEGHLERAASLAGDLLEEHPDPGLTHTLALARAASGENREAIGLLTDLVARPEFEQLPAEVATQVHLDLATLHRGQGSLFKAIPALTKAVETAARADDPVFLEQAADALIEQLVEQGGADEAVEILSPWLDDRRTGLWQRVLTRLGSHLEPAMRERGMDLMIAAGDYRTVLNLLIDAATRDEQALLLAFTAALALRAPVEATCPLAARLLASDEARRGESAPLIAAASVAVAEIQEDKNAAQAKWHRDGVVQLISVAKHHGILEEEVRDWAETEGLYHEHGVIERAARHCLEKIEQPPEWLRQKLTTTE
ncbi:hypothetical protein AUR63_09315 [Guyparkeria sp. XI15]|nr:hypothetical protein AUR63_09315 [Guyparkeria sp. XI15]OAE87317.1 hypothetical protein AWR35_09335 [Guyparkeria sp. WRN-7]